VHEANHVLEIERILLDKPIYPTLSHNRGYLCQKLTTGVKKIGYKVTFIIYTCHNLNACINSIS